MVQLTQVRCPEQVYIRVTGDVDPHEIEDFRRQLLDAVTDTTHCVTVDAARLSYLYSDGLDVLVELARKLRRSRGEVRLINAAGWLCRLLEQTRLDQIITVSSLRNHRDGRSPAETLRDVQRKELSRAAIIF